MIAAFSILFVFYGKECSMKNLGKCNADGLAALVGIMKYFQIKFDAGNDKCTKCYQMSPTNAVILIRIRI